MNQYINQLKQAFTWVDNKLGDESVFKGLLLFIVGGIALTLVMYILPLLLILAIIGVIYHLYTQLDK